MMRNNVLSFVNRSHEPFPSSKNFWSTSVNVYERRQFSGRRSYRLPKSAEAARAAATAAASTTVETGEGSLHFWKTCFSRPTMQARVYEGTAFCSFDYFLFDSTFLTGEFQRMDKKPNYFSPYSAFKYKETEEKDFGWKPVEEIVWMTIAVAVEKRQLQQFSPSPSSCAAAAAADNLQRSPLITIALVGSDADNKKAVALFAPFLPLLRLYSIDVEAHADIDCFFHGAVERCCAVRDTAIAAAPAASSAGTTALVSIMVGKLEGALSANHTDTDAVEVRVLAGEVEVGMVLSIYSPEITCVRQIVSVNNHDRKAARNPTAAAATGTTTTLTSSAVAGYVGDSLTLKLAEHPKFGSLGSAFPKTMSPTLAWCAKEPGDVNASALAATASASAKTTSPPSPHPALSVSPVVHLTLEPFSNTLAALASLSTEQQQQQPASFAAVQALLDHASPCTAGHLIIMGLGGVALGQVLERHREEGADKNSKARLDVTISWLCGGHVSPLLLPLFRERQLGQNQQQQQPLHPLDRPVVLVAYGNPTKNSTGLCMQPFTVVSATTTFSLCDRVIDSIISSLPDGSSSSSSSRVAASNQLPTMAQLAPELFDAQRIGPACTPPTKSPSSSRVIAHAECVALATTVDHSAIFFYEPSVRQKIWQLAQQHTASNCSSSSSSSRSSVLLPLAVKCLLDSSDRSINHRTLTSLLCSIASEDACQKLLMRLFAELNSFDIAHTLATVIHNNPCAHHKVFPYLHRTLLFQFGRGDESWQNRPLVTAWLRFKETITPFLFLLGNSLLNARGLEAFSAVFGKKIRGSFSSVPAAGTTTATTAAGEKEDNLVVGALCGLTYPLRALVRAHMPNPGVKVVPVNPYTDNLSSTSTPAAQSSSSPLSVALPWPTRAEKVLIAVERWLGLLPTYSATSSLASFAFARGSVGSRPPASYPAAPRLAATASSITTINGYSYVLEERGAFPPVAGATSGSSSGTGMLLRENTWMAFLCSDAVSPFLHVVLKPISPYPVPSSSFVSVRADTEAAFAAARCSRLEQIKGRVPIVAGFVLWKQFQFLCKRMQRRAAEKEQKQEQEGAVAVIDDDTTVIWRILEFARLDFMDSKSASEFSRYTTWMEGSALF